MNLNEELKNEDWEDAYGVIQWVASIEKTELFHYIISSIDLCVISSVSWNYFPSKIDTVQSPSATEGGLNSLWCNRLCNILWKECWPEYRPRLFVCNFAHHVRADQLTFVWSADHSAEPFAPFGWYLATLRPGLSQISCSWSNNFDRNLDPFGAGIPHRRW